MKKRNKKKHHSAGLTPEQLKNIGIQGERILQIPIEDEPDEDISDEENTDAEEVEEQIFGITGPDEEATAAYVAYMKKKAQKADAASVSASSDKKAEPVKVEEPTKVEEPVKVEEAPKADEPVKEEEPAKEEEPVKEEEPPKVEEPAKAEEPAKEEEPAKAEEPVKTEEPAKADEPVKAEEAPKEEEPAKEEEPVKTEEPAKADEPVKVEEAPKEEEPAKEKEPEQTEKTEQKEEPAKEDEPEKKEEPVKADEPAKDEEPVKESTGETIGSQEEEDKESNRLAWIMIGGAAGVVILAVLAYIFLWGGKKPALTDETTVPGSIPHSESVSVTGDSSSDVLESSDDEPVSSSGLIEDTEVYSVEYKIDDADESVLALMTKYYNATADCDIETIRQCYYDPKSISIDEKTLQRKAQIIDGYRGIKCYNADGLNADEMVLYVLYEIKFKEVQTPAPTLIRFYLKKDGDDWKIYNGPITDELRDHLNKMTNNRDVISLMVQVNRAFSQACDRDDELGRLIRLLGEEPESDPQAGAGSSEGDTIEETPNEA